MPFKNAEQAAAMHAKADRGEIPRHVVDEFDHASTGMADGDEVECPECGHRFAPDVSNEEPKEKPSFADALRKHGGAK